MANEHEGLIDERNPTLTVYEAEQIDLPSATATRIKDSQPDRGVPFAHDVETVETEDQEYAEIREAEEGVEEAQERLDEVVPQSADPLPSTVPRNGRYHGWEACGIVTKRQNPRLRGEVASDPLEGLPD
eukprot:CAMPEP_0118948834 /NCGR_PEP_ID=MMETSP1169-20130426/48534_1 /TAXON_ID=36882 /ORGANISM="Pyramimonas obovata, Strain CCMP722" /LENGTH=128 /DNA_ID=CAMNT_0006895349 /DNA_START=298 /DNA_END=681 /DNA_ORIENTATION=+